MQLRSKKSAYVPVDDEFDEEVFQPVKRAKKTPLFMELLRPIKENRKKAAAENDMISDDEFNEFRSSRWHLSKLFINQARSKQLNPISPSMDQPITPIIRDFQEQVFQEAQQAVRHPSASSATPDHLKYKLQRLLMLRMSQLRLNFRKMCRLFKHGHMRCLHLIY